MAVFLQRKYANKPPPGVRPNLGHPILRNLISAWYMREGAGDIQSVGAYWNPLSLNTIDWAVGGQRRFNGRALNGTGVTGIKAQSLSIVAPSGLASDQTWAGLATPKASPTGQDIWVDGANRQLRLETDSGGTQWQAGIGNGATWQVNDFAQAGTPTAGRTALVGVTKNSSNNSVIFVVDETGSYTATSAGVQAADATTQLYVGDVRTGSGFAFNGYIHALWWWQANHTLAFFENMWESMWQPFESPGIVLDSAAPVVGTVPPLQYHHRHHNLAG